MGLSNPRENPNSAHNGLHLRGAAFSRRVRAQIARTKGLDSEGAIFSYRVRAQIARKTDYI